MRPTLEIQADKLDEIGSPAPLSRPLNYSWRHRGPEKEDLNRGVDLASMQEDKLDRFSIAKRSTTELRFEEEDENVQADAIRSLLPSSQFVLANSAEQVSGGNAEAALKDGGSLPSKIRCLMGARRLMPCSTKSPTLPLTLSLLSQRSPFFWPIRGGWTWPRMVRCSHCQATTD